jgi:class 3 adenylate cyclase
VLCPKCGEANGERAKFCSNCATPLGPQPQARQVRKTVTILFADVVSSTALGERLDPESLRELMTSYFSAMKAILESHGATVEKFIGDAVMAVFGIPNVHEDDAQRAVRAAAEMRDMLRVLNEDLERDRGVGITVRTGINTGEIVAGDPLTGQTLVTGDAVNAAARLEQAAHPGEILLDPLTYRLVRPIVEAEPVAPIPAKGKTQPLPAYRLLSVVRGVSENVRRLDAPLIGRGGQLSRLQQSFDDAIRERRCELFTLLGSAGVGKSRLVREFLEANRDGAVVFRGRCLPYGEGITFWPIAEIVREAAAISNADTPAVARGRIAALLKAEEGGSRIEERLSAAIGLVDLQVPVEEIFWGFRKLLEALGAERSVVVVIDDVHWAEPTLLDLIEHVSDWSRGAPILLVVMARPELLDQRPSWAGGKLNATSILLEPLPESDAARLVEQLLGATVTTELRDRIVQAAEGNPLFVEELVAMLVEDGVIVNQEGRWTSNSDLSTLSIPASVAAVLAARLDGLADEERSTLERASVVGRIFWRGAVAELTPAEVRHDVMTQLLRLVRKELIRPDLSEFVGDDAFRFRHLLLRDAAYATLPKGDRAELHLQFAEWLKRMAADRVPEYEEILAYHLEQAYRYRTQLRTESESDTAIAARAAAHLEAAGRRAMAKGDVVAAAKLLGRAAELLPATSRQRLAFLPELAMALTDVGDLGTAEKVANDASALARILADERVEARALVAAAFVASTKAYEPGDLRRMLNRPIEIADRLHDHATLAMAWRLTSRIESGPGHLLLAREAAERALEHAEQAGDRRERLQALWDIGRTFWLSDVSVPEALARLADLRARAEDDRRIQASLDLSTALFVAASGRIDEARAMTARGRATFEDLGLVLDLAGLASGAGDVERVAGDLGRAEAEFRRGVEASEGLGERAWLSTTAGQLADVLVDLGRLEEAWHYTELGESRAAVGDVDAQARWRKVRARILARRGQFAEAERLALTALELADGSEFLELSSQVRRALSEVLVAADRPREAAIYLQEALVAYERTSNVVEAARVRESLELLSSASSVVLGKPEAS